MKYNTIVYIGRFRPSHLAHIETMKRALAEADQLLILCGSSNQPRTCKNPWTVSEVEKMIKDSLPVVMRSRVIVMPLRDIAYNDHGWVRQVQDSVRQVTTEDDNVGIIGYSKDESSYYLQMFPQWKSIDVGNIEDINATDIRNAFFECDGDMTDFDLKIGRNLPPAIHDFMKAFALTEEYEELCAEYKFLQQHAAMWEGDPTLKDFIQTDEFSCIVTEHPVLEKLQVGAPYPVTFITCDAVVVQAGHVLLIRRRAQPGRNLYAMPGGYLDGNERIEDGIIRELREETKIKVPEPVLRGSIKHTAVYDAPKRSPRGRIVTHVALIELSAGPLPKVKGSDDADKAKWVPLSVFARMENQIFEDHFHIINDLLSRL